MASTIKVNNIQNQCGANIVNKCSTTITLGASGDTIQLACGASQTGFGRTGTVNWDTTAKTSSFTAESGDGYFVNTTSGAITVTLPATPSTGDIVAIKDYANTADTNNITIARNGSNIDGTADDPIIANEGGSVTLVYVDATKGWLVTDAAQKSDIGFPTYIVATGGTVTTCGDFKIHTFTSPGTFCVSSVGNSFGSNSVDYLVVAGGAGGGNTLPFPPSAQQGGGGGAGGLRASATTYTIGCGPASPLVACVSALPVSVTGYPITVGGGGSGGNPQGSSGSNSVFSTITSAGGGGGGIRITNGANGGSGGGGGDGSPGASPTGGTGNTPPVAPPQGNSGGGTTPASVFNAGGGGGGIAVGEDGDAGTPVSSKGGAGGGFPSAFGTSGENCGSFYYFAGGGGGAGPANGVGGLGGGGQGSQYTGREATAGTANTGGGGGGGSRSSSTPSPTTGGPAQPGGSGIVIIRYKYQ